MKLTTRFYFLPPLFACFFLVGCQISESQGACFGLFGILVTAFCSCIAGLIFGFLMG